MANELVPLHSSVVQLLHHIGADRAEQCWELLCDNFFEPFKTKEAIKVIAVHFQVAPKTASCWWNVLQKYWLQPGGGDLIKIRSGVFFWSLERLEAEAKAEARLPTIREFINQQPSPRQKWAV